VYGEQTKKRRRCPTRTSIYRECRDEAGQPPQVGEGGGQEKKMKEEEEKGTLLLCN